MAKVKQVKRKSFRGHAPNRTRASTRQFGTLAQAGAAAQQTSLGTRVAPSDTQTGNHEKSQAEHNNMGVPGTATTLRLPQKSAAHKMSEDNPATTSPQNELDIYPAGSHTDQAVMPKSPSLQQVPITQAAIASYVDLSQTVQSPTLDSLKQALEKRKLRIQVMEEILEEMKEQHAALEDEIKDWNLPRLGARIGIDERKTPRGRAPHVTFGNSAHMARLNTDLKMQSDAASSVPEAELLERKEMTQETSNSTSTLPRAWLPDQPTIATSPRTEATLTASRQLAQSSSRQPSSQDKGEYDQQFLDIFRTTRS